MLSDSKENFGPIPFSLLSHPSQFWDLRRLYFPPSLVCLLVLWNDICDDFGWLLSSSQPHILRVRRRICLPQFHYHFLQQIDLVIHPEFIFVSLGDSSKIPFFTWKLNMICDSSHWEIVFTCLSFHNFGSKWVKSLNICQISCPESLTSVIISCMPQRSYFHLLYYKEKKN